MVNFLKHCRHIPARCWVAVLTALSGTAAQAQVEVCNESKIYHYAAAIASWNEEAGEWVSRGWFNLSPRQCATALAAPLTHGYVYLHAKYVIPSGQSSGNDFVDILAVILSAGTSGEISGKYSFCTQQQSFTLVGNRRCASRDFDLVYAVELELGSGARGASIELYDEGRYSFSAMR